MRLTQCEDTEMFKLKSNQNILYSYTAHKHETNRTVFTGVYIFLLLFNTRKEK